MSSWGGDDGDNGDRMTAGRRSSFHDEHVEGEDLETTATNGGSGSDEMKPVLGQESDGVFRPSIDRADSPPQRDAGWNDKFVINDEDEVPELSGLIEQQYQSQNRMRKRLRCWKWIAVILALGGIAGAVSAIVTLRNENRSSSSSSSSNTVVVGGGGGGGDQDDTDDPVNDPVPTGSPIVMTPAPQHSQTEIPVATLPDTPSPNVEMQPVTPQPATAEPTDFPTPDPTFIDDQPALVAPVFIFAPSDTMGRTPQPAVSTPGPTTLLPADLPTRVPTTAFTLEPTNPTLPDNLPTRIPTSTLEPTNPTLPDDLPTRIPTAPIPPGSPITLIGTPQPAVTPAPVTFAPMQQMTPAPIGQVTPSPFAMSSSPIGQLTLAPTGGGNGTELSVWLPVGETLTGENAEDTFGHAVDVSSDGRVVVVGADKSAGGGPVAGAGGGYAEVFAITGDTNAGQNLGWSKLGSTLLGEAVFASLFGRDVQLSANGNIVAIGAPRLGSGDNNFGYVEVYRFDQTVQDWRRFGNRIVGTQNADGFGTSISLSEDGHTIAVGAPFHNSRRGWFQVYEVLNNTVTNELQWTGLGGPIAGIANEGQLGTTVALDGVGARVLAGSTRPEVSVYGLSPNRDTWVRLGDVINIAVGNPINPNRRFHYNVAMARGGRTVAVGAVEADFGTTDPGHLLVYDFKENGVWAQRGQILDGIAAGDGFGHAVQLAADGNTVAATARNNNGGTGHARILRWDGTAWKPLSQPITGDDSESLFGHDLALSADARTVVISSRIQDKGEVDIFHRIF